MFRIGEVAKLVNISTHTIRFYTTRGLLTPKQNPSNGYHYYDNKALQRLNFILLAKRLGYTLSEIEEILQHADRGHSPCPRVREIIEARVIDTRQKLKELNKLQNRMERAISRWNDMPNGMPNGDSVCYLIENEPI